MIQSIVLTGTMEEICAKLAYEGKGLEGVSLKQMLETRRHEKYAERMLANLKPIRRDSDERE